jgi:hypothetical protein
MAKIWSEGDFVDCRFLNYFYFVEVGGFPIWFCQVKAASVRPYAHCWLSGWGRQQKKSVQRPEESRAEGPTDGRRPCARVARDGELSLVRALPHYKFSLTLFSGLF